MIRPVATLGLIVGVAHAAPPIEMIDHTIVDKETCSSIAEKYYGDKLRWDVVHDFNPQLGPKLPHGLEAGQVLRLPKTLPPDAWVTGVRRAVEHRPSAEGAWRASQLGTQLRLGFRVATKAESAAELTFLDDSQLHLREDTLIVLYGKGASGARRETSRARLERGALRGRLAELVGNKQAAPSLVVSSSSAESSMSGGEAIFSVDGDGASSVSNHSAASIAVKGTAGGAVKVSKGMGTRVRAGERPAAPRKLPPKPTWWGPGALSLQGAQAEAITLQGRWSADGERVRLSVRPIDAPAPIAEAELAADQDVLRLRGLPAGTYALTLALIDEFGLESLPSNALTVELQVTDRPIPVARGAALPLPPGALCAGPDGPTDRPTLTDGQQTLTCTDAAGVTLRPLTIDVQPLEATLSAPKSAPAGKPAKLRVTLKGKGLPQAVDAVLPDGQRVPLKPDPRGWLGEIPVPADAGAELAIALRDPSMPWGAPLATLTLPVKGGAK